MSSLILSSPHEHGPNRVSSVMLRTTLAVMPGWAVVAWLYGWGILVNTVIIIAVALITEVIALKIRKRSLEPVMDGSAILTAILIALTIPPYLPWWIPAIGAAVAIGVIKHLYGGLGSNVFNPAMGAFVTLIISFPVEMTQWTIPSIATQTMPSLTDALHYSLHGGWPVPALDALSGATPLDHLKTMLKQGQTAPAILAEPEHYLYGLPNLLWASLAYLVGGLWLLQQRIISWHIPVSMLASMAVISGIFWAVSPEQYASPAFHVLGGATMIGAFFIATDPVSSCTTARGRIWFGIGCGVFTWIIRTWGGYPDAVAFSVLLMNMAAPLIDYYSRPKVYGH